MDRFGGMHYAISLVDMMLSPPLPHGFQASAWQPTFQSGELRVTWLKPAPFLARMRLDCKRGVVMTPSWCQVCLLVVH